jgi:hypothetical protein
MKLHRLLPLLVALGGLSGCPEEDCFDGTVGGDLVQPGMILVGEETLLRPVPSIGGGCGTGEVATPTGLAVEVYDPDNQPVEHQSSLGNPSTLRATIRFTARKPGRHHVFIAFEPVGGIQQLDLYAAIDSTSAAPPLTLRQPCTALERTQQGAFVCGQDVVRDGTLVQRFPDSLLAVVGDVVWVVSRARVQRYVDTGSTLTLTATLENGVGPPQALHASENELVVLYSQRVQRFTVSGTGLSTAGPELWTPPTLPIASSGPQGLALRTGDHLAIVTRTLVGVSNGFTYQLCPYGLEAGRFVRTPEDCSSFTGVLVGYEKDSLWVGDPQPISDQDFTSLRYLQWTATGLVEQASLPLSFNLKVRTRPFLSRQTAVPTIATTTFTANPLPRTAVPLYSADRRAILMEYLGVDVFESTASRQLMWAPEPTGPSNGGIFIRVRPSAP